jgi:hypothetical protein
MQIPNALAGCEVRRTSFDGQVRLLLIGRDANGHRAVSAELIIESSFSFRDSSGKIHQLQPGTSGPALGPVIGLFMQAITAVAVRDRGTLTLDFNDGSQIVVEPHPKYESWHLLGNEGVSGILVGPGGETGWHD